MNKSKISTRTLTQAGFSTAISIVLTRFVLSNDPLSGRPSSLKVRLGELPIIMSGLLFGPFVGGLTGLVADQSVLGPFHKDLSSQVSH